LNGIYSYKDYAVKPFLATLALGELLQRSALRLFLGAGASAGFGLPSWKLLLARVLGKDHDAAFLAALEAKSPTDQRRLIDPLDDGSEAYLRLVHSGLYRDAAPDLLAQLQKSPLLLAVAAMMTGLHRGRIDSVITYNYDDLLEQYLRMLGLSVCRRMQPDALSTRADVELNYPHGRLPQAWSAAAAPPIILSEKSYRARRAEIDQGWPAYVVHGLHAKIALFLGMSGDDASVLDTLKRAQNRVQRADDYTGYWLLTPDAFQRNKDDILEVGMCPIRLEIDEIPKFIFEVCQHAAA
jgi:hypothetical protein